MDTLYEWLIKNTGNAHLLGNEGQYFTILNVQRETNQEGAARLDCMVRNRDFHVRNLLIYPGSAPAPGLDDLAGRKLVETHSFHTEEELTAYFSVGKKSGAEAERGSVQFQVFVLEPTEAAGEITFPPKGPDSGLEERETADQ
jgi:hypothetical protein